MFRSCCRSMPKIRLFYNDQRRTQCHFTRIHRYRMEMTFQTMRAFFPDNPNSRIGQRYSLFSLGLVVLTLFALSFSSFHHHSDIAGHPDCDVCAFSHQVATTALASPTLLTIVLPFLTALTYLLVLTAPTIRITSLLPSRAPPP